MYGLALLGVGYYSESEPSEGYPNLKLAGLIEEMVVLGNSDSPGGLHYVIHSYDQPPFASRALESANRYLNISVEVPHALHMPSHIYGDLGLWEDMINANILSLNLAFSKASEPTGDWYHGSYFLQFGMLQKAMDCDARSLMESIPGLAAKYPEGFGSEASVRVPTEYFVEMRDWEEAASFDLKKFYPTVDPSFWTSNAWTLVTANFVVTAARAVLDFPHSEISAARQAVDDANQLLSSDPDWEKYQLPYFRLSFDVMVESAHAWEAFRVVSMDAGITAMEAVRESQRAGWSPEVAHAWDPSEQLAEMLLIRSGQGDVASALAAYEDAISMYPNRYRSVAGAGKCADMLKDNIKASRYYGDVSFEVCMVDKFLICS